MPCINMMTGQPFADVGDRGMCVAYGGDWMEEPSLMQGGSLGTSYPGPALQNPQKINLMNNINGSLGTSYPGVPLQNPQKINLMNNINGSLGTSYPGVPLQNPQKINLMNNLDGSIGESYPGPALQNPQKINLMNNLDGSIGESYPGPALQNPQKINLMNNINGSIGTPYSAGQGVPRTLSGSFPDTDDFGNDLSTDFEGTTNFGLLRDRAVDKFSTQEYNRPFYGEVSRTGTSQPRMIQTENGLRPMTEQEMVKDNQYNAGQKIRSIFGQDDASIESAKANQAPVTDKFNLADWNKLNLMNNINGSIGTSYPGVPLQDPNKFDSGLVDRANMNVYKGPMTDRWAAKPGDYRIGRSYSMGEGDWRDPVGGTEYNYTDTDFAGNPLDTDFEGNVPSEADRAKIREMRKGTGTSDIYPGDSDTLFDRKTVESAVTDSTVTGTSGENMDDGTGSASTEGEGKGSGEGEGKGNTTPPAVVIKKIATGEVKGKDADNLWGKIQSKGFWSTPIEGGAGKWDNRLFRLGEMMEHMGTPLSQRGDSPTKRWTTTAKDSAVATGKVKAAKAKMEKDNMTRLYNRANLDTSNVAASILHYLPKKGWFARLYSGMSEAERKSYSKAIVLKAEVIMNTLLDANPPVEVSMEQALIKAESMITIPDQQGLGGMTVKPEEK